MRIKSIILFPLFGFSILVGCNQGFLDLKRDKSQVVPLSIGDFNAMLDNFGVMNVGSGHALGIISGDEHYLPFEEWQLLPTIQEKNAYTWAEDVFAFEETQDWNTPYLRILYSNIILEGLLDISPKTGELNQFNRAKGGAYFHRGMAFYQLSQQFSQPYGTETLNRLGLPLRLQSDPTAVPQRATVEETYNQIFSDIHAAINLLPHVEETIFRPSKLACHALLSRIYLQIGEIDSALAHAEEVLSNYNSVMDYNMVDSSSMFPFPSDGISNVEIILYDGSNFASFFHKLHVDTNLLGLYHDYDLRKALFFKTVDGSVDYRGSYSGGISLFTGLAVDELLLIKAECLVRKSMVKKGMDVLEKLLSKRYAIGHFAPFNELSASDALKLVLDERIKELLFRGLRWSDLRRFQRDSTNVKTLLRNRSITDYELTAGDLRYTMPIPNSSIAKSGLEQNPR